MLGTLLAMVSLSGCAAATIATDLYAGFPPGADSSLDTGYTPIGILTGDGDLALVTYGSSSCPPTVTAIDSPSPNTVTIEVTSDTEGVCTADMAPTTHIVPLPGGATERPLTVTVDYAGSDQSDSFRVL